MSALRKEERDDRAERRAAQERRLNEVWKQPERFGILRETNNTNIGRLYILTACGFLLAGGVLALLMRVQLAVPGNDFLDAETYNQVFTMHGTTMMFLFAVPVMEAIAVQIVPNMLGARDLPFPRLSAYGYWSYLIGGTLAFSSIFFGVAPASGWFMYPPLTAKEYEPGLGPDIWLLGLGFIEVAAIAASVELIVGVLKFRAPGMTLGRIPLFAWYMLTFAVMICIGFPPLILGDILLELERALGMPFYDPDKGGDPVLWQHLFWLFGHPEVYIIFLPAAGVMSMVIPTMARTPFRGYTAAVLAAATIGFMSFGLWVHHMYTVGLPELSLSFFSAASMAIALPMGVQVFAWIATIWCGTPRYTTAFLFALGAIVTFVMGGLTGVMVAVAPFDWQVHDTYFVVAHLHYVLIGGAVFPLFAGAYYWIPLFTSRMLSERLGRWVFTLVFVGFHVAFLPMHLTGLVGMPRRVFTYPEGLGWDGLNLVSSVGAFILAAGIALFVADFLRHFRFGEKAPANPWNAGTLEWLTRLPSPEYGIRSVPRITSRYPLWDQPDVWRRTLDGEGYLPDASAMRRESLVTSVVDAQPESLLRLPPPTWIPLIAAVTSATCFGALTVSWYWTALAAAVASLGVFLWWAWTNEHYPDSVEVDVGHGVRLPVYRGGSGSHGYWAMAVVVTADASVYASLVFAYFYLWTISPAWPPAGMPMLDDPLWPVLSALLLAGSAAAIGLALRANAKGRGGLLQLCLAGGSGLLVAACLAEYMALHTAGLVAQDHAYAAVVWTVFGYLASHAFGTVVIAGFAMARAATGWITPARPLTLEVLKLFWLFTVGLGLVGLAVTHLFPQVVP